MPSGTFESFSGITTLAGRLTEALQTACFLEGKMYHSAFERLRCGVQTTG